MPTTIETYRAAAVLKEGLARFPAEERERLAAAVLHDFAEIYAAAGSDDIYPPAEKWTPATTVRAVVDAVEYLADRARLLDRLEDALPDLGRAEWEIERKRKEAVA